MYARLPIGWPSTGRKHGSLRVAVALLGHASWLLRRVTAVRSRQSRNKQGKEQKGRTWQPRTTTPTSNGYRHNRATAPVSRDTVRLLVTPRQKPTSSQASAVFIRRESGGREERERQSEQTRVLSNLRKQHGKAAFSHPSMKLNVGEGNEVSLRITVKAIIEARSRETGY